MNIDVSSESLALISSLKLIPEKHYLMSSLSWAILAERLQTSQSVLIESYLMVPSFESNKDPKAKLNQGCETVIAFQCSEKNLKSGITLFIDGLLSKNSKALS